MIDDSTTVGDIDVPRLSSGKLPKERFASLREEISKAKGEVTAMAVDPMYLLGYSFIKENKDGDKVKATVTAIDKDSGFVNVEYIDGSDSLMEYNDIINTINA